MQGSSKVIMGATLVMAVSLAIVVALVFVLLAELYCSLLLRRRRPAGATNEGGEMTTNGSSSRSPDPSAAKLSSFYAQGVLAAPRSLLFPAVAGEKQSNAETEDHHFQHHQVQVLDFDFRIQESKTSPRQIGILSSPQLTHESRGPAGEADPRPAAAFPEHLVYISNPIYENRGGTPFETPDTSPSRLESSGDEESQTTPPLSPMKKLPAEACSVSLRDGSDSNSANNGQSSSSSGSPRTSPSW